MKSKVTKASSNGAEQWRAAFLMMQKERKASIPGRQQRHRDWTSWEGRMDARGSLLPNMGGFLSLVNENWFIKALAIRGLQGRTGSSGGWARTVGPAVLSLKYRDKQDSDTPRGAQVHGARMLQVSEMLKNGQHLQIL